MSIEQHTRQNTVTGAEHGSAVISNGGAIEASWAFPIASNLMGYVHTFGGDGQSLIDYNYVRESIGVGVLLDL